MDSCPSARAPLRKILVCFSSVYAAEVAEVDDHPLQQEEEEEAIAALENLQAAAGELSTSVVMPAAPDDDDAAPDAPTTPEGWLARTVCSLSEAGRPSCLGSMSTEQNNKAQKIPIFGPSLHAQQQESSRAQCLSFCLSLSCQIGSDQLHETATRLFRAPGSKCAKLVVTTA